MAVAAGTDVGSFLTGSVGWGNSQAKLEADESNLEHSASDTINCKLKVPPSSPAHPKSPLYFGSTASSRCVLTPSWNVKATDSCYSCAHSIALHSRTSYESRAGRPWNA